MPVIGKFNSHRNAAASLAYPLTDKTRQNDARVLIASGQHCMPGTAARTFAALRRRHRQPGGVQAYHAIQSFSLAEADSMSREDVERVHEAGQAFAAQMWPQQPVLIVTQADGKGGQLHNHIVVCSTHAETGKKLRRAETSWHVATKISDEVTAQLGFEQHLQAQRFTQAGRIGRVYGDRGPGRTEKRGLMHRHLDRVLNTMPPGSTVADVQQRLADEPHPKLGPVYSEVRSRAKNRPDVLMLHWDQDKLSSRGFSAENLDRGRSKSRYTLENIQRFLDDPDPGKKWEPTTIRGNTPVPADKIKRAEATPEQVAELEASVAALEVRYGLAEPVEAVEPEQVEPEPEEKALEEMTLEELKAEKAALDAELDELGQIRPDEEEDADSSAARQARVSALSTRRMHLMLAEMEIESASLTAAFIARAEPERLAREEQRRREREQLAREEQQRKQEQEQAEQERLRKQHQEQLAREQREQEEWLAQEQERRLQQEQRRLAAAAAAQSPAARPTSAIKTGPSGIGTAPTDALAAARRAQAEEAAKAERLRKRRAAQAAEDAAEEAARKAREDEFEF